MGNKIRKIMATIALSFTLLVGQPNGSSAIESFGMTKSFIEDPVITLTVPVIKKFVFKKVPVPVRGQFQLKFYYIKMVKVKITAYQIDEIKQLILTALGPRWNPEPPPWNRDAFDPRPASMDISPEVPDDVPVIFPSGDRIYVPYDYNFDLFLDELAPLDEDCEAELFDQLGESKADPWYNFDFLFTQIEASEYPDRNARLKFLWDMREIHNQAMLRESQDCYLTFIRWIY